MSKVNDNRKSILPFNRHRSGKVESLIPPSTTTSSFYTLTPTQTNQSDGSSVNGNYRLTKMETNDSFDSNYSLQQQFRVQLNLNRKEMELIRYTWNKMLLDEPIVEKNSSLPIPGGFQFNTTATASPKSASNIASSLFCRQLYSNLLSKDSSLEKLFPSIKHQAVAFAGVLSFTVSQLESLSTLDDYLENLGKRHSRILGIEPNMFELMGEALIQTFHERFGNKFNQELEILWIKLYLYLANSILQFGIDPILKLHQDDKSGETSGQTLFKLNEINEPLSQVNTSATTTTNSSATMTNTTANMSISTDPTVASRSVSTSSDLFGVDDRKQPANEKKKKKKRDNCVVV